MPDGTYRLAICGAQGGTGRSSAAAALAWCWGRAGFEVTLADADPQSAAAMIAAGAGGSCPWPGVRLAEGPAGWAGGLVVIDTPNLAEPETAEVLGHASGVLLCCRADPMSVRTVRPAAEAVHAARSRNPGLELLGILTPIFDDRDPLQPAMLERLRESHGELVLEPAVPWQPEWRDWGGESGAEPPAGPARDAYLAIAEGLAGWLRANL